MNFQATEERVSDNRNEQITHAFGYAVPIGKDGRRLWPKKFKREMVRRMISGQLTAKDIQNECGVSDKVPYQWKKAFKKRSKRPPQKASSGQPVFNKVKIVENQPKAAFSSDCIILKNHDVEVQFPLAYPVTQIAQFLHALHDRK